MWISRIHASLISRYMIGFHADDVIFPRDCHKSRGSLMNDTSVIDMHWNDIMSGFTCYFVDRIRRKCICTICRLPMRDPVQIKSCGHRFCDVCLQEYLRWVQNESRNISNYMYMYPKNLARDNCFVDLNWEDMLIFFKLILIRTFTRQPWNMLTKW